MKRFTMSIFVKMKPNKSAPREIILEPSGFLVAEFGKTVAQVSWSTIKEIFVFKQDMLTHDLICVGFRVDNEGNNWEVTEDFVGYKDLQVELARRFPGIRIDWFADV